ncbi:AI-2E family transporter (plasmid) [Clostridium perfringens]
MKIDWNKKYTTIAMYVFLVVVSCLFVFLTISNFDSIRSWWNKFVTMMHPFIIGVVLAYLLNFILNLYERVLFSYKPFNLMSPKVKRGLGILCAYISALMLIMLFFAFVLPQVIDSINGLISSIPKYLSNISVYATEISNKIYVPQEQMDLLVTAINDSVNSIIAFIANLLPIIIDKAFSVTSSILNIVMGIIISIYILIDKERFAALSKKIAYAILDKQRVIKLIDFIKYSENIFSRFIGGKILDSAIIGVLTFIILVIAKIPYTVLIAVIIGVTNVIPVFGPFIGAIPCVIILFFIDPSKALWFILIIIIIQQIDGNIIGPYILGDSVGVSAFWILFSVLIFSKMFGIVGMVIGVPIFAVFYSLIKTIVEEKLKKKRLPLKTEDYL